MPSDTTTCPDPTIHLTRGQGVCVERVPIEERLTRHWDGQAMGPWLFDGTTSWSYDDPTSLKHKTDYVRHRDLGGVMLWGLTGDTDDGDLISAIHRGLARVPD